MRSASSLKHAQSMRKEMTEPEKKLWYQLRAKRFHGIKFRRQKVIGPYITDFAANQPKLVIELGGDAHASAAEYDAVRTRYLEAQGYHVLRFWNNQVTENMDGVLMELAKVVEEFGYPPLPTLSPEGERA